MATVFLKLEEIREIYKKENCQHILISGDFFHLKSWTKNPYLLVSRLTDYFNSFDTTRQVVFGIFGDHDTTDRGGEGLERQPLGMLAKSASIRLLNKGEYFPLEDGTVITGAPKTDEYESDITNYVPPAIKSVHKLHIHMVHGDLYPKKPVYAPWTSYEALKDSPADITLRGHIHRNDGIVQVGKTQIVGIGSLTRGTLNTDAINRRPSVAIINTDTKKIKVIELQSAPEAKDIFDFDKKEAVDKAEAEIDRLSTLIKLESKNQQLTGPEQVFEEVRKLKGVDENIKTTALKLLETAREYL